MRRVWAASAALVVAVLFVVALTPQRVAAHAGLESSSPAANAILETSPSEITLDFDEPIAAELASITLFDSDAKEVELGEQLAPVDSSIVQVGLPSLDDGVYVVVWRVSSVDGHVIDGAYSFQIGTSANTASDDLLARVTANSGTPASLRWADGLARGVGLLALAMVVGGVFLALVGPPPPRLSSFVRAAAGAGALAALAGYALYAARATGGSLADAASPSAWGDVWDSRTGRYLLLRLAAFGALLAAALWWSARDGQWWRTLVALSSAAAVLSWSASGHAAATTPAVLWIGLDVAHLVASALWVGGLLAMVWCGRQWRASDEFEPIIRRFSSVAAVAVPLIVVTGVLRTFEEIGSLDRLTAAAWGKLLLVKLTLAVTLIALGGAARWLLRNNGVARVGRSIALEAVVGVAVLGVTAAMVGTPPRLAAEADPISTSIASGGVIVELTATPALVGANELHIVVSPPGGNLKPVQSLTARVALPSGDIPNSPVTVVKDGVNHYTGSVTFPEKGEWTLDLIVETEPAQTVLLSTTLLID
jgi:copper transport protein